MKASVKKAAGLFSVGLMVLNLKSMDSTDFTPEEKAQIFAICQKATEKSGPFWETGLLRIHGKDDNASTYKDIEFTSHLVRDLAKHYPARLQREDYWVIWVENGWLPISSNINQIMKESVKKK